MRRLLALAASALALWLLGSSAARAQRREPPAEAMQFFDEARVAYAEGRYEDAAVDLERALVLDLNAPTLLFNLGRVYELLGRYDDAIRVMLQLRAVTPLDATEELARTEQTLERLRGAREHAAPPPTVEVVGTLEQGPTYVREHGVADDAFWGTLVAGGALVVSGAILGGLALAARGTLGTRVLGSSYSFEDYRAEHDRVRLIAGLSDGALAVGGATLIAAVVLFAARERTYEQWPDHAGLSLELGLGGAALRGVF